MKIIKDEVIYNESIADEEDTTFENCTFFNTQFWNPNLYSCNKKIFKNCKFSGCDFSFTEATISNSLLSFSDFTGKNLNIVNSYINQSFFSNNSDNISIKNSVLEASAHPKNYQLNRLKLVNTCLTSSNFTSFLVNNIQIVFYFKKDLFVIVSTVSTDKHICLDEAFYSTDILDLTNKEQQAVRKLITVLGLQNGSS